MRKIILAGVAACALIISIVPKAQAACDDRYINTCDIRSWHWSPNHRHSEFRESHKHARHHTRVISHARVKIARAALDGAKAGGQASVVHGGLVAISTAAESRPRDCYGIAWCGCWLRHVFGIADRSLNLAINWAHKGSPASPDNANVVVWRHHVGKLIAHNGNRILIQSGNDRGAVRTRWVTTNILGGVVAFRRI